MGDQVEIQQDGAKEPKNGLAAGPDGAMRCHWHGNQPDYMDYHDLEWGRPVASDQRLFEKLCLEGFQAGLSWLTILRKRENFREAFHDFDFERLANCDEWHVEILMRNSGIIRHRQKIAAVFNNARRALEMCERHGSLARFLWSYEPRPEQRPSVIDYETLKANPKTEYSKRLSKDLKELGWTFVGPVTIYSFMQAMGVVNDHLEGCMYRPVVELERRQFKRPA